MLIGQIKKENMIALKEKNNNKRAILSVVINKYMIAGYEAKANGKELTDADLIQIINKTLKELDDEKANFLQVGKEDKAKEIDEQIETIKSYVPKIMTEEEIKEVILSLEDRSIPFVMKHFKANYAGKCDMGIVNKVLKSL